MLGSHLLRTDYFCNVSVRNEVEALVKEETRINTWPSEPKRTRESQQQLFASHMYTDEDLGSEGLQVARSGA